MSRPKKKSERIQKTIKVAIRHDAIIPRGQLSDFVELAIDIKLYFEAKGFKFYYNDKGELDVG